MIDIEIKKKKISKFMRRTKNMKILQKTKFWIPPIDLSLNQLSTFWNAIAIFNVLETKKKKILF